MGNKQTAVDFLFEQIRNGNITSEKTNCGYFVMINDDCLNKAKQMEQKQIVEAFHEGMQTNFDPNYGIALKYYELTYGK